MFWVVGSRDSDACRFARVRKHYNSRRYGQKRGGGVLFLLDFFVSLSATLRENGWTDLHEIFREGVE